MIELFINFIIIISKLTLVGQDQSLLTYIIFACSVCVCVCVVQCLSDPLSGQKLQKI